MLKQPNSSQNTIVLMSALPFAFNLRFSI
jgi:hypothetical protein